MLRSAGYSVFSDTIGQAFAFGLGTFLAALPLGIIFLFMIFVSPEMKARSLAPLFALTYTISLIASVGLTRMLPIARTIKHDDIALTLTQFMGGLHGASVVVAAYIYYLMRSNRYNPYLVPSRLRAIIRKEFDRNLLGDKSLEERAGVASNQRISVTLEPGIRHLDLGPETNPFGIPIAVDVVPKQATAEPVLPTPAPESVTPAPTRRGRRAAPITEENQIIERQLEYTS